MAVPNPSAVPPSSLSSLTNPSKAHMMAEIKKLENEEMQDLNLLKDLDEEISDLEAKKEAMKELMEKTLKENKEEMAEKRRDHTKKKREADEAKLSLAAVKEMMRTRKGINSFKPRIELLKEMTQVRKNIDFDFDFDKTPFMFLVS